MIGFILGFLTAAVLIGLGIIALDQHFENNPSQN